LTKQRACRQCHFLTSENVCPNCKSTNLSSSYTGIVVVLPSRDSGEDPRKASYIAERLNIDRPGKYALKVR
jgi:DNA-directed RNA polymerase subunit E"